MDGWMDGGFLGELLTGWIVGLLKPLFMFLIMDFTTNLDFLSDVPEVSTQRWISRSNVFL